MADMTRTQIVEFLNNTDKSQPVGMKCNYLGDLDLSGLDLSGLDLSHLDLQYTDFTDCNLSGVNMDGSFLCGTKFVHTNLKGATMRNTEVWNAKFSYSDMVNVDLSGMNWTDNAVNPQFHCCNLVGAKFVGIKGNFPMTFCNLTDASFDDSILTGSQFIACILSFASFRNVDLREINLNSTYETAGVSFEVPNWTEFDESGTRAITNLHKIDLTGARLNSRTLTQVNYR